MNRNVCKHWKGSIYSKCGAGINWKDEKIFFPDQCNGRSPTCKRYEKFTDEEWKKLNDDIDKAINKSNNMFKSGLSSCCNAPIDTCHLIKSGRHKGHGPRYCSKCGKCVYYV